MTRRAKAALRRDLRTVLAGLSEEEVRAAGSGVAEHVLACPIFRSAGAVALYSSFGWEVPTGRLVEAAWAAGKVVALPRVVGPGALEMKRFDPEAAMVPGCYCITEPPAEAEAVGPEEIDLWLVPGLAFDGRGGRLGRGGGYYDRLLSRCRDSAAKVGLAHDIQLVPEVPREDLDIRMDKIVTPRRVVERCEK